jgi:hypothetical protein
MKHRTELLTVGTTGYYAETGGIVPVGHGEAIVLYDREYTR